MNMPSFEETAYERKFLHIAPSRVLFCATRPVVRFDDALRVLVSEMYRVMHEESGVGLAAPQVGESVRVAVIDLQGRSLRKQETEEEEEEGGQETEEAEEAEEENDCREAQGEAQKPFALVNPEIVWSSEERRVYEEGCLSFPDLLVEIERPREVEVRYWDLEGVECLVRGRGLLSVCLQHEIDHLEGRTIVDFLSRLKRSRTLRKFAKQAKQAQQENR